MDELLNKRIEKAIKECNEAKSLAKSSREQMAVRVENLTRKADEALDKYKPL